jgi:quinol monooxygenase YgiN
VVAITARIESGVPERRELGQALQAWATSARREAGVHAAHVYEDMEAPAAFCVVAQWEDQHAIEAHLRGAEFGALLGALELLAGPPQWWISTAGDVNGSDALRTIRRLRSGERGALSQKP